MTVLSSPVPASSRRFPFFIFSRSLLLVSVAVLTACAPIARIRNITPKLAPPPGDTRELRVSEQFIGQGNRLEKRDPHAAIGYYIGACQSALAQLHRDPSDKIAMRDYNFALSRMFAVIEKSNIDPWSTPLQLPSKDGGYVLTCRREKRALWNPSQYRLIPADQMVVGGTAFDRQARVEGLGATLVAVHRTGLENYRTIFLGSKNVYYGITAVARFEGKRCVISFEDPMVVETVNVDGRVYTMAADYTTAPALMLVSERPDKLGLIRLIFPGKYDDTAHISRLQPYDPKKTPVLFIHGLQDTPATWARMINTLHADPVIRKHYQLWVYSYPSGYPFPFSAMVLRQQLDAIHKAYPDAPRIIVVGHSMGGLITRLMITNAGDKIWLAYFRRPPEKVNISAKEKKLLVDSLIFNCRPEVARVVFISTPHRGSVFASNWIGRIGSAIVRMPATLVSMSDDVLKVVVQDDPTSMKMRRLPNSIDTLAPNNRFLRLMGECPMDAKVPYHSIMGDRGRNDTPDSSDGIVAYSSSHLDGAVSEKIVPSGHMANQNTQGIEEVDRILRKYVTK